MHPHVIRVMLDIPLAHMSSMMTTAASRSVLQPLGALQPAHSSRRAGLIRWIRELQAKMRHPQQQAIHRRRRRAPSGAPIGVWGPPPPQPHPRMPPRSAQIPRTDPPRGGERSRHPHHKRTKHEPRTHTNSKHTERRLAQREDDRVAMANPSLNDRDDQPTANQNA